MKKSVQQYLQRYAASETQLLQDWPASFQRAMLIPAKDEPSSLIENCQRFCTAQGNTLLVLVVNQGDSQDDRSQNKALWDKAKKSGKECWQKNHLHLLQWPNHSALLLIDRFSQGLAIPHKEGVGLARKIAADIIAHLIAAGKINSPWIYSSDADCAWPCNYFDSSELEGAGHGQSNVVAAHFAFEHSPCDDKSLDKQTRQAITEGTKLYEKGLHYYQQGLAWAGSPYAFYTIGSCLAFHYQAYCEVRGFPPRAAGEDFYLLNKLAKQGNVAFLGQQIIHIDSRLSQRAPFGTGPAVSEIIEKKLLICNYASYHPMCFYTLKDLLQDPLKILSTDLDPKIKSALENQGLQKFLRHLKQQNVKADKLISEFHNWFDAFHSLKFIHYLRDHHYPSIPLQEGLAQLERWQASVNEK
ncbi:hypothetical protein [uncultured Pseudoteredinibacter sp.]|uniref:hypothetical protein n=1 Tax=uncultured Pseudoteredinibacter sp. TaxID=1641701 RepID=UPI00262EDBAA|nr:hypothetical protein [uncultured Pseudoteredinibacter sp.]